MVEESETQVQQSSSRFGIAQMMIVVAICAFVLACAFPSTHIPGRPKPGMNAWNIVLGLSEFTVGAFSLLGGAVVVSHWIRDRKLPEDPGCLLFLFCAFAFLFSNAAEVLYALFLDKLQPGNETQGIGYAAGLLYVRCVTQVFLAFVCAFGFPRNRWWWQLGFLGLMFSMLSQLGMTLLSFSLLGPNSNSALAFGYVRLAVGVVSTIVVLGVLLCGAIDLAKKERRSRMHWLGVLCFLTFAILPTIAMAVASRYLSFTDLYGVE